MATSFSIGIPVWNDGRWLPRAIEGVLGQTHHDWELVIGDNASTEDLAAIIGRFSDQRIRYERWETHVDLNESFNRTAAACHNDWVLILSADDRLHPACLARMASAIESVQDEPSRLAMVVGACRRLRVDGRAADHLWRFYQGRVAIPSGRYDAASWLSFVISDGEQPWNIGSFAVARSILAESGGLFRPEVGMAADHELAMRAAAYGDVIFLDDIVGDFTVRTDSDTPSRLRANLQAGGETVTERAVRAAQRVHERRRVVTPAERRALDAAVARSYIQRAAQHRLLSGGRGRRGALRDVLSAARISPGSLLTRGGLQALAAVVVAGWVLRLAERTLAYRR